MNKTQRVSIACFLGAGIGTLLALQFNHYFWWAGVLIGGLVGYLAFDLETVSTVLWNELQHTHLWEFKNWITCWWKQLLLLPLMMFLLGYSWVVLAYTTFLWFFPSLDRIIYSEGAPVWLTESGWIIFAFLVSMVILSLNPAHEKYAFAEQVRDEFLKKNIFTVLLFRLPKGIVKVLCLAPRLSMWVRRVVTSVFIQIHSDMRLLCMTDSLFGGLIGYGLHNVVIGAILGCVLGVINYKIISLKVLKLGRV